MKEKENWPYGQCGCCRKCQPPCCQQKELADKAYKLACDAQSSTSEIVEILSRIKKGKDVHKDANLYSLHISNVIGALVRMQNLIGDLWKGGVR